MYVLIKPKHIRANCELMVCVCVMYVSCMCHVCASADASRTEAPQKRLYFSKSENTGRLGRHRGRLWGWRRSGWHLLSHSGRCLPGDRRCRIKLGPCNWGAPFAPVTTRCLLCDARTPAPQCEASGVQELRAWACLHHCEAASRRHHFSQIHLSPTSSLYPARYLRPGSCGTESMVTSS